MGRLSYLKGLIVSPSTKTKEEVLGVPSTTTANDVAPSTALDAPAAPSAVPPTTQTPEAVHADKQARMLRAVVEGLKVGKYKNIVVMCGAGISVSAGIPDFRSRTGMYQLECLYNLPHPMAVFSIDYFKENPRPFYHIIRKMILKPECTKDDDTIGDSTTTTNATGVGEQGTEGDDPFQAYKPTKAHCFFKLLQNKGLLRRVYTQNVDCLERVVGLDPTKELVQVHGTIASAHCSNCGKEHTVEEVYGALAGALAGSSVSPPRPAPSEVPRCLHSASCDGALKPDVTFFGEAIPKRLFTCAAVDFPVCDLLLCMGSTFQVMPFSNYLSAAGALTPRVLFNLEPSAGFAFDDPDNYKDVFAKGPCDDTIQSICDEVGWGAELQELFDATQADGAPTSGYAQLKRWEAERNCDQMTQASSSWWSWLRGTQASSSWWSWLRGTDKRQ